MGKKNTLFMCTSCGAEYPKWSGKCYACNEWDTIVEVEKKRDGGQREKPSALPLSSLDARKEPRMKSGIGEFDLVCGGGIVPGSLVLVGGEPGIGKSTLSLQIAQNIDTLYISGEESPAQISLRAGRIGIGKESIALSTNTAVEDIIEIAGTRKEKPFRCIIVDSIQTVYSAEIPGVPGSVGQIRESAMKLAQFAKKSGIAVVLIGHITKDGSIAGPKLLEHLVDTVLYFEGDNRKEFRLLRAFKNRYGSVNEIGLFRMTERGLEEIRDKNRIFLNPFLSFSPGNAVSAAMEGSRTILFEVQSLVTFTSFSNPRRMADGLDLNRLVLIIAVLEKHGGQKLGSFDVFINVSGGFQIRETSADLAVAMAIASSLKERPVRERIGLMGEIALSGEVRPVSQCSRKIQEFRHSGFGAVVLPEGDVKEARESGFTGEIIGVRNIQQALDALF